MFRTASRALAAGLVSVVTVVALQSPAMADPVLGDEGIFRAEGSTEGDSFLFNVRESTWNAVVLRGSNSDYDLHLNNIAGQRIADSIRASNQQDFIAVNTNGPCAGFASSLVPGDYPVSVNRWAAAPQGHGDFNPGYVIASRSARNLEVVAPGALDRYTAVGHFQNYMAIWQVDLRAGHTYRVAWNTVPTYYEGDAFLLPAASDGITCVHSRSNVEPVLSHLIEDVDPWQETRSGETRFTATVSGMHALVVTLQGWDLSRVSIGGDALPHVMVKEV